MQSFWMNSLKASLSTIRLPRLMYLILMILRAASKGSNLLLNIGPQPDGNLPATSIDRLNGIGEWMKVYGESVYGTGATGIPEQSWGVTTCKDRILYLHLVEPLDGVEAISLPIGSCLQELGCGTGTAQH